MLCCVQYRPAASRVGGKSLADNMLANYDEALIHSRLAAEREQEDKNEGAHATPYAST